MNSEEKCFLRKVIWKKAIPEPLLTIKTHKKVLANGNSDSRFIVPSDMFTAGFCKVGFKAIKAILDKHGVMDRSATSSGDLGSAKESSAKESAAAVWDFALCLVSACQLAELANGAEVDQAGVEAALNAAKSLNAASSPASRSLSSQEAACTRLCGYYSTFEQCHPARTPSTSHFKWRCRYTIAPSIYVSLLLQRSLCFCCI